MVLVLIFVILTILCAVAMANYEDGYVDFGNFIQYSLIFAFAFAFLYGMVWLVVSSITVYDSTFEERLYGIEGLENVIETKESISGKFILGCGGVNGSKNTKMKYYYFKVNDYGKALEELEATSSEVYLKETNTEEPCLIQVWDIYKTGKIYKFLFGNDIETKKEKCKILVVPEGTIKIDYNVEI